MRIFQLLCLLSFSATFPLGDSFCAHASQLSYKVAKPTADTPVLKTPFRVLVRSIHRVAGHTGFAGGELATQHIPLLNVINAAQVYERVSDYIADPLSSESIEKRRRNTLEATGEVELSLRHREHDFQDVFVQLGGQPIFFGYTENYLWRFDYKAKMNLQIPSVGFTERKSNTETVTFHFYQLDNQLTNIYVQNVRADAPSVGDYWKSFSRSLKSAQEIKDGLSQSRRGKRAGYIFNTCVQFNSQAPQKSLDLSKNDLCWKYSAAEQASVLPLTPSPSLTNRLSAIASLVERTTIDADGSSKTEFAFFNLQAGMYLDLSTLQWIEKSE